MENPSVIREKLLEDFLLALTTRMDIDLGDTQGSGVTFALARNHREQKQQQLDCLRSGSISRPSKSGFLHHRQ